MTETLPETHKRQIEAAHRASLRRAGFGEAYISRKLSDSIHGQLVADWLSSGGAA